MNLHPIFQYLDRTGQGMDHNHNHEERSPVFLQFLDAVHQLLIQFPCSFEYHESLLVFLADHVHSGAILTLTLVIFHFGCFMIK